MANPNQWAGAGAGGRPPSGCRIPTRGPQAPASSIPAPASRLPTPGAGRSAIPSCCMGGAPPPAAPARFQGPPARGLRPPQVGVPRGIPVPARNVPYPEAGRPPQPSYGQAAPRGMRPAGSPCGQAAPQAVRPVPSYGQAAPQAMRPVPSYGQAAPQAVRPDPSYGQATPPAMRSGIPSYGQATSPAMRSGIPSYGQATPPASPCGQAAPPGMRPAAPSYGQAAPPAMRPVPSYGPAAPPAMQPAASPCGQVASPAMRSGIPSYGQATPPAIRSGIPSYGRAAPPAMGPAASPCGQAASPGMRTAAPSYGQAAPPAMRPGLRVPTAPRRIPSPTATRAQAAATPSALPDCCRQTPSAPFRPVPSTTSQRSLGSASRSGLRPPGFSRPAAAAAPAAAIAQCPSTTRSGYPQSAQGRQPAGPAPPSYSQGLRPPARAVPRPAASCGAPRSGMPVATRTPSPPQAATVSRPRSPYAAASCGSSSRYPAARTQRPPGRAAQSGQVPAGVPVQKESYTRCVKKVSLSKTKAGAGEAIAGARFGTPSATSVRSAAGACRKRGKPAIPPTPSPAMTSPQSPFSTRAGLHDDDMMLDDIQEPWSPPSSPGPGSRRPVTAPCSPRAPPMSSHQSEWGGVMESDDMVEDTDQPYLVDDSYSESELSYPTAYMQPQQSYGRPMTAPCSAGAAPMSSQRDWSAMATDDMIEDTEEPWLADDSFDSFNEYDISPPNTYMQSTQLSHPRYPSPCGAPSEAPSDMEMQAHTGNAASNVIENLRSQEEYEMNSMMQNLRDLQIYRRKIIGSVLPDAPLAQESESFEASGPSPCGPVQGAYAQASGRPPRSAQVTTSNILISVSSTQLDTDKSTSNLPETGTYSQELFSLVKM